MTALPWEFEEEWSDIQGYEGTYWVSSQGRVISRPRLRSQGGVLKTNYNSNGYAIVSLSLPGRGVKTPLVHKLVMNTFVGPPPPGHIICHRNGDPGLSCLSNLRYDTPASNSKDMVLHGTNSKLNKARCPSGHEYTDTNTYYHPVSGWRYCRTCRASKMEEAQANKKECPICFRKIYASKKTNKLGKHGVKSHKNSTQCLGSGLDI